MEGRRGAGGRGRGAGVEGRGVGVEGGGRDGGKEGGGQRGGGARCEESVARGDAEQCGGVKVLEGRGIVVEQREGRLRGDLEGVGATEVAGVVAGSGEEEREHVEVAHDLAEVGLGGEQEGLVHDLLGVRG